MDDIAKREKAPIDWDDPLLGGVVFVIFSVVVGLILIAFILWLEK